MQERWSSYFLKQGCQLQKFWKEYLEAQQRNVLFILGLGFDPRMCYGLRTLLEAGGTGKRDCVVIQFEEGTSSPSYTHKELIKNNEEELCSLVSNEKCTVKKIPMNEDGRRVGSMRAANIFTNVTQFTGYTEIVIDISAMPREIYFPLIGKILYLLDFNNKHDSINLHTLVSENAKLDSRIIDEGMSEDANYMYGFGGHLQAESTASLPKIWIPILGHRQNQQLQRVYDLVQPNEICPMIPSPSSNARSVDDLLLEYRELLFDRLRVEARNFIYVAEQNPFEVYREILNTTRHYETALETIGGCQVVISPLSSKLLSVGGLLAAYELRYKGKLGIGVAHVESLGYRIEGDIDKTKELNNSELFSLWLAGDCYAP